MVGFRGICSISGAWRMRCRENYSSDSRLLGVSKIPSLQRDSHAPAIMDKRLYLLSYYV